MNKHPNLVILLLICCLALPLGLLILSDRWDPVGPHGL